MNYEIKKAKIVKGERLDIAFIKDYGNGERNPASEEFKAEMHPDAKQAFSNLRVHLALMVYAINQNLINEIATPDEELISTFHIHGYSIGGDEDDKGVVLSGHRILPNGKAFNFSTPFYRFNEGEETRYKFMDDLMAKLERVDKEIRLYVDGEKRAKDPQGSFDFENGGQQGDATTKLVIAPALSLAKTGEGQESPIIDFDKDGVTVDPAELLNHINANSKGEGDE